MINPANRGAAPRGAVPGAQEAKIPLDRSVRESPAGLSTGGPQGPSGDEPGHACGGQRQHSAVPVRRITMSPPRPRQTREDGVEQATLQRRVVREPLLTDEELRVLAEVASGVTTEVAAKRLDLSTRTLRRRLRIICARIGVGTPIQAVVWAARRHLI
jgi:DNA-binding CsgD family transcriptional regulator